MLTENYLKIVTFNVNKDRKHLIVLYFIDPYYDGPDKEQRVKHPDNPQLLEIDDPDLLDLPVTSEGVIQQYACINLEPYHKFVFDFENLRLIEYNDPENIINLREVRDTGTGYEFYYDPDRKNMVKAPADFKQGDSGAYLVRFRYLVSLHPYAMSVCNHVPFGKISAKTDKEFMEKAAQWKAQHQSLQKVKHIAQTNKGKKRRGKSM